MSSQKTEHYQLHQWSLSDEFQTQEVNENFQLLDTAARVVVGTYVGDGAKERLIDLGFTPQAVLVVDSVGQMHTGKDPYGGLALPGFPAVRWPTGNTDPTIEIVEGGFQVFQYTSSGSSYWSETNSTNRTYYYLAVK